MDPEKINRGDNFPIPSKLNALILLLQLSGFVAALLLLRECHSYWQFVLLFLYFAILMNSVYSSLHEAHHAMLFNSRFLNDTAGIVIASFFPAPFHLLRQGHLTHHAHNRTDDEVFDLYFERDNKLFKTIFWYCILLGIYWLWVAAGNLIIAFYPKILKPSLYKWDRTSQALLEGLKPRFYRIIQLEALAIIILHISIVWFLKLPPLSYFLMYYSFGFLWSAMQYVHHYLTVRDILHGARNLKTFAPIDQVWMNHNFHLTHHLFPTVPWYYLPSIKSGIPDQRSSLVRAYLGMWRGPWKAEQNLESSMAGRPVTR